MKNKTLMKLSKKLDANMPTILTGFNIVTGLATMAYALYAGYSLKSTVDELPKDATGLEKAKAIAPKVAPVVIGAGVSTGCAIAAQKKNSQKYAALAATMVAMQTDRKQLRKKAEEVIGREKMDEIKGYVANDKAKETVSMMDLQSGDEVVIHDLETGFIFKTNLKRFYTEVIEANERADYNIVSMAEFYQNLLENDYDEPSLHSGIGFGIDTDTSCFRPRFDSELGPDMKQRYTIEYPYAVLA